MKISYMVTFVLMLLEIGVLGCSNTPSVTPSLTTVAALKEKTETPTQTRVPPTATIISPLTFTLTLTTASTPRPPPFTSTRSFRAATPTTPPPPSAQKRFDPQLATKKPGPFLPFDTVIGVVVTDLSTNTQTRIFGFQSVFIFDGIRSATWSPDGKKVLVAFRITNEHNQSSGHLRIMNTAGDDGIDIFGSVGLGDVSNGIWSADGQRIVFWANIAEEGQGCTFIMKIDGAGRRRVNLCEYQDFPRYWSVDGKWVIVYFAGQQRGPGPGFYALEVDGNRRVPLSQFQSIKFYDERYFPWRITDTPCSIQGGAWQAFWNCQ